MDHTESSLTKLDKEDLVRLLLDYRGKSDSIVDDLKNNFDDLKTKLTKLEADLNISRNVNSKISDRVINVERKSFANEQHSEKKMRPL